MATEVAFLRAVNVGGRSIVKMTDVQAAFAAAGCTNVGTCIASGNVLFDRPAHDVEGLRLRIHQQMQALLGAEPVIVFRSASQLRALVNNWIERELGVPATARNWNTVAKIVARCAQ